MSATPASPLSSDPGSTAAPARSGFIGYLSSLFWVEHPAEKRREIFPGWWEVLAGTAHGFFGYGFYLYAWATIVAAMAKEFSWSATAISVTGLLVKEGSAIEGPIVGWLVDRYGPQWTGAVGWLMGGIGFLLMPLIFLVNGDIAWIWLCYGILVAVGMNSAVYATSWKAVNRWFIKNRALGLGLVSSGSGFGSPILIPVGAYLVTTYGWRGAVTFIGVIYILMGVTSSVTLFRRQGPEPQGYWPDNEPPAPAVAPSAEGAPRTAVASLRDFTVREAVRTPSFWLFTLGGIISQLGGGYTVLPLFQSARMQDAGYTVAVAALWYALDSLFSAFGRASYAMVGDFFHPRWALGLAYIFQGLGFYAFAMADNIWWLVLYAVFHGFFYGFSIPPSGVLIGALFGRERFGSINGISTFVSATASFPGPIVFGFLRDMTGGFYIPFTVTAITTALGGVLYLMATTPKGQIEPGRRATVASR